MADGRSLAEDPADRTMFETIRETYALALEPEQQAMIRQLRSHLRTVPAHERNALIADIERSVGQDLEEELEY